VGQAAWIDYGRFAADPDITLNGNPTVGTELSATVADTDPAGATLTYQWERDGDDIDGATDSTYTPVDADAGHYLSLYVTASAEGYYDATGYYGAQDVTTGGTFSVAPVAHIVGTPTVGSALQAVVEDTTPVATNVQYQWLRDGVAIPGATDEWYFVQSDDTGAALSLRVTTGADGFNDASTTSSATSAVTNPTPPATSAPVVTFHNAAAVRHLAVGQTAKVSWTVTGASIVRTAGAWGEHTVPSSGIYTVTAKKVGTLTYKLTANGPGGTTTRAFAVTVRPAAAPPTKVKIRVSISKKAPIRGVNVTVHASRLAPGERYRLTVARLNLHGNASKTGTLVRRVYLPRYLILGHRKVTVTGLASHRTGRTTFRLAHGKRLTMRPASTSVAAGQRTSVRVSGLAAHEPVVARYRGVRVSSRHARANVHGVYTAQFNVGRTYGKRLLVVHGSNRARAGRVHLSVQPAAQSHTQ
jgi:hypothetical protein